MKHFSNIMLIIVIFHAFVLSSSDATPIHQSPEVDDISSEQILQNELGQALQYEDIIGPFQLKVVELKKNLTEGSYDLVLSKIAQLSENEVENPEILSIRIAALIGVKKLAEAKKEISRLYIHKNIPEESFTMIAQMHLKTNKHFEAMRVCQKGLEKNMRSPRLLFVAGMIHDSIGQSKTALIYFKKAAELDRTTEFINKNVLNRAIANSYLKLKDFKRAKDVFNNEEKKEPKSLIEKITFAKYYASRCEYSKAIDILDNTENKERIPIVDIIKAQIFILEREPEKAIGLLSGLEQQAPQSYSRGSAEMITSLAYLLLNDPKEALSSLAKIKRSDNKPPNLELVLAIIHLTLKDKQSAIQALRRAPMPFLEMSTHDSLQDHLEPPSLGPALGYTYFCLDQGYYRQAVEIVKYAISKAADNIFFHFLLAESYRRMEKYNLALAEFKQLKELMPESYALRFQLCKAYEEAGMRQEALKAYAELSKERPDFLLVQLAYGGLLERLEKWDIARDTYALSLNFKPDSVPLLTSLAWTLTKLQDFETLTPVLRTLKANNKTKPSSIWHLEGWGAYLRKDYPKAIELLTKAMDATPGEPELCYHLGMAYFSIGQRQEAENLLWQAFLFPKQREKYQKQTEGILSQK